MQLKSANGHPGRWLAPATLALLSTLYCVASRTDVLPEDRVDALATHYSGGGQDINGLSFLVRKKIGDHVSVSYNHLEDIVSGASIDVRTSGASPYRETRTQDGLNAEFLYGKTTYTVGVTHSYEPDYRSNTASFGISQSMFGDLTTISMTYHRTWNDVFKMVCLVDDKSLAYPCVEKVHDPAFGEKDMDERSYGVGITQILTRNAILSANFEVITDQGWLSNPYRSMMYVQAGGSGFALGPEVDPSTRTSNALGLDYKYYLPWHAALDLQYRYFEDTWGIRAHTAQIGYTQPWRHWTFDGNFRFYTQTHADFYSDLFASANEFNFMSRNRELSSFNSFTIGTGASYEFHIPDAPWISKSTANFRFDHFMFDYKDFRDALLIDPAKGIDAGAEPLYTVGLNVMQLFLSVYY
ncbi:MAG TPA: DUF3570 domain-containing protein [Steroidobacteraceae bacterium]|jgi:hypothetical protein|nr:DUF3570 domain-containing protein [Steroidobacteraceae bacterium]